MATTILEVRPNQQAEEDRVWTAHDVVLLPAQRQAECHWPFSGKGTPAIPRGGIHVRPAAYVSPSFRLHSTAHGLTIIAVYSVLTELPAVFVLYDSSFWSGVFLLFIFAVSVWNGGGFYIEVFGRKCASRCFILPPHVLTTRPSLFLLFILRT